MGREELSALTELHAWCLLRAREHERAAARLRFSDPNRSELAADQARGVRDQAAALAKVLAPHGIASPDRRQMALWSDGGSS